MPITQTSSFRSYILLSKASSSLGTPFWFALSSFEVKSKPSRVQPHSGNLGRVGQGLGDLAVSSHRLPGPSLLTLHFLTRGS